MRPKGRKKTRQDATPQTPGRADPRQVTHHLCRLNPHTWISSRLRTLAWPRDEDPTQPSRGIPAESVGVPDPAVGARADGARDASGMKSASFSRAGVASGEAGAASGEAIDFRHQSRGDGLEAFVEETEASVLGAGIVDGRGIRPVEGTETVGISHRKVHLSAGYGPLGRQLVYDWFNRPVLEPIQSKLSAVQRKLAPTVRKRRIGNPYQQVP